MSENRLSIADKLAIERTNMANQRTLLAYFRTFIILLSSEITIIKIDFLKEVSSLGIILIAIAPTFLIFGIF